MTNGELIRQLTELDPAGTVQIFAEDIDSGETAYYDVKEVTGFCNGPDAVLTVGAFRAGGS